MKDLVGIITDGFNTWKDNPIICAPFLIGTAVICVAGFAAVIITLLSVFMPFLSDFREMAPDVEPEMLMQMTGPAIAQSGSKIIVGFLIFAVLVMLIRAFFGAGGIGMAKEASETGVTIISDMVDYGKDKFIDLFLADVIVGLITLVGFLFLIPGILSAGTGVGSMSPRAFEEGVPVLIGLGFLLMMVYMLIFTIMLSLVRYAVVVGDLEAIEGVKKGFEMFLDNKVDVFLLCIILGVINVALSMISGIGSPMVIISFIATLVIVRPLSTVWWTHLYMDRAERG